MLSTGTLEAPDTGGRTSRILPIPMYYHALVTPAGVMFTLSLRCHPKSEFRNEPYLAETTMAKPA